MKRVVIIGGGVIGLCTALELARCDVDVTVIDARVPGSGASTGNAGWIVPSLAGPVPAPGVVATALGWMLRPDSPLMLRPRMSPAYGMWLYRFWRSSTAARYRAGLEATARLGAPTFALFDRLAAEGVQFEMHESGVLFAYADAAEMERDRRTLRFLEDFGYEMPEPLIGPAVREVEPALTDRVRAAYVVPQERSIRPESLVAGLLTRLDRAGVKVTGGTPCLGLVANRERIVAARTPEGDLEADAFVVAAGVATLAVLGSVGARLPIEAGKGYTVDYARPPRELRRPVYLHDDRLAITPFDDVVRVAGVMELGATDAIIPDSRIRSMARTMHRAFDGWPEGLDRTTAWTGMRPMTPDGLPVIGMLPGYANLAVASGHAMLGVTLAPATGAEVASLITTGQPSDTLRPFAPERFSRATRRRSAGRRR